MYKTDELEKLLWNFGVNKKYLGFDQTVYGLELCRQDIGRLEHITKKIYPDIAKQFHTSPKCVERNIRTMVNTIWKYGNRELLQDISRMSLIRKPTNTMFFKILLENLYGKASKKGQN